ILGVSCGQPTQVGDAIMYDEVKCWEDFTWCQSSSTRGRSLRSCAVRPRRHVARGAMSWEPRRSNGRSSRPWWSCWRSSSHESSKVSSKATPTRSSKAPPNTRSAPRRFRRGDRGASALEFSIIAPILLLLIFTIIQGGLYFYARNTAQSASREGVSYLRLAGNNADPNAFIT